ncbi:uncharacterized protein LOC124448787 isoform X2 [Xenia sp. Carnegie-2017]|uniref:uncharacterized protein LOC124448787 isoform X2 n=1 Tax=Xenia sp. Carnegie-2017 TaxID=2897299 RepID=UPI001F0335B2|nr:uncharacterized protein LOC124448787 isoform X2 [Xenia sp. Carnegie-2017]
MFQCVKIVAKFLSAVNEILSTNSRNLPVYNELISLAEKGISAILILVQVDNFLTEICTYKQRLFTRNSYNWHYKRKTISTKQWFLDAHDLSSHETPSKSFMNITPAGRRSQPNINGFQRSVLTKLETLIVKQEETLSILRALLSATKGVDEHEILEDVVPNAFDSV